ncbi:MAG: SDR family oxidoreductase [Myxococcota bacterium]|nr:SDR family oxidoreductase [Myxococcota bacterium]
MSRSNYQTVLITGGAGGLGKQMARQWANLGATIVLWDRDEAGLAAARDFILQSGASAVHTYTCDLTDRDAVRSVGEQVLEEVGPIDVLVNNAGIVSGKSLLEISDEEIVRTFEVNSLALFWTSRVFLPEMLKRRKGHIVTIASSAGLVGVSKLTDYCSSKWAAVGFDESLRMELRQTCPEVKTTVVCPFFIDTGMFDGVKSRFEMLLPILKEESMAKDIVEGVEAGKTRIVSPDLVKIVPIMRALPTSVFDWVADFLGINVSMEEFVGKAAK